MLRMRLRPFPFPRTCLGCAAVVALCTLSGATLRAQQTTLPLWPHALPQPEQTTQPEMDMNKPTDGTARKDFSIRLTNVTHPTLTVFAPPAGKDTHAAMLVFPGGGYSILALNGEGLDACKWLNSLGMTCVLVKYRVPEQGHFPANPADLEDAQQAMRITRAHAAEWHLDPNRIGVMGFSAGGNLATLLSLYPDDHTVEQTPAAADVDTKIEARPSFTILGYPAYLAIDPEQTTLDPTYLPNASTPLTFIVAAENDLTYGKNSLVYYRALMEARRPAELHMFATGGHGFGMFPKGGPAHWTEMAAAWLHAIRVLPTGSDKATPGGAMTPIPCPMPQPPMPGRPSTPPVQDPNCL
jgi:acetyl esterase/lipase